MKKKVSKRKSRFENRQEFSQGSVGMRIHPTEHGEQVALFQWALLKQGEYPELELMFAIPNGGHRHKATGGKLKAEGVKAGVPDIFLPCMRVGDKGYVYPGLFIEMKRVAKGRPTEIQEKWLKDLRYRRYFTSVCYGFEDARETIMTYLNFRKFKLSEMNGEKTQ